MPKSRTYLALIAVLLLCPGGARAENRVTVRGQYYREPSTRVVQPVAEMSADLPAGLDLSAHYLLDAITSASAAAGPSGDNIFTEYRSESGVGIGKTWSRVRVGAAYKYSGESDYWSHTVAASVALRTWQDTGTLALSGGLGWDQVGRRPQGNAPVPTAAPGAACAPTALRTCPLDSVFAGVGYSQVLSPTLLVQGGYELAVLNGYLASAYRAVSPYGMEKVPDNRVRQTLSARAAKYFPRTRTGIQLQYRYYWDLKWDGSDPLLVARSAVTRDQSNPWQVISHTIETRVFQGVGRDVDLRVTGRYYSQGPANFWCDQRQDPTCYGGAQIYTSDPKLQSVGTVFVEGKVYWEATRWRDRAFLGWFSDGTFELSYGVFLQNTAFANAHVLQTGYSLPF
jgi:Protein of unknown function (DUF3570)